MKKQAKHIYRCVCCGKEIKSDTSPLGWTCKTITDSMGEYYSWKCKSCSKRWSSERTHIQS